MGGWLQGGMVLDLGEFLRKIIFWEFLRRVCDCFWWFITKFLINPFEDTLLQSNFGNAISGFFRKNPESLSGWLEAPNPSAWVGVGSQVSAGVWSRVPARNNHHPVPRCRGGLRFPSGSRLYGFRSVLGCFWGWITPKLCPPRLYKIFMLKLPYGSRLSPIFSPIGRVTGPVAYIASLDLPRSRHLLPRCRVLS